MPCQRCNMLQIQLTWTFQQVLLFQNSGNGIWRHTCSGWECWNRHILSLPWCCEWQFRTDCYNLSKDKQQWGGVQGWYRDWSHRDFKGVLQCHWSTQTSQANKGALWAKQVASRCSGPNYSTAKVQAHSYKTPVVCCMNTKPEFVGSTCYHGFRALNQLKTELTVLHCTY